MHAGLDLSLSPVRVYLQRLRRVGRSQYCCQQLSTSMFGTTSKPARGTTDQPGLITEQLCVSWAGPVDTSSFGYAAFHVVKEEQVYQRYLTLYNRRIRFPAVESRPVGLQS